MDQPKHACGLMGRWSAARKNSVQSGRACAAALQQQGLRVAPIDVGGDIANVLRSLKPDTALNLVHGPGLDGSLRGLSQLIGIPYSHCSALAAALVLQGNYPKAIRHAAGVPVGCSPAAGTGRAAVGGGRELTWAMMGEGALALPELSLTDGPEPDAERAPPGRLGISFRQRFHQMFTNWSENWRWRRIVHSRAEG